MSKTVEEMRRDRMRPASCRLKNHYDDSYWAEKARLKQQSRHGWLYRTYECDLCGEWHLTRVRVEGKPVPIVKVTPEGAES